MSVAVLLAVVGAIGLGVAVALALQPQEHVTENVVLGRLENYIGTTLEEDAAAAVKTSWVAGIRLRLAQRDEAERGTGSRVDQLADALTKANVDLGPTEWRVALAAVGVVAFGLTWLLVNLLAAPFVGIGLPYLGGRFLLNVRQRRRVSRFDGQLGDVCLLLGNSLRAGYSFAQALDSVSASAKSPSKEEFGRAQREIALGVPLDDALHRLVERNDSEDLDLMVTAVQIQRVVGGNLAEILDTIARTIRERVRIRGEIRTLTAQARVSGWIISLLPIGLSAILAVIAPDYFGPMFHELLGLVMLGVGLVMMLIGILVIRKIVDIKI